MSKDEPKHKKKKNPLKKFKTPKQDRTTTSSRLEGTRQRAWARWTTNQVGKHNK